MRCETTAHRLGKLEKGQNGEDIKRLGRCCKIGAGCSTQGPISKIVTPRDSRSSETRENWTRWIITTVISFHLLHLVPAALGHNPS